MVVTSQPFVFAACTAKPPQPVPISSTWSPGPYLEPVAHQLELRRRGLRERHPSARKVRGGVHHGLVEHQFEELVAEIVVGGDAASAARVRVACADAAHRLQRDPSRRQAPAPLIEAAGVACAHAYNGGEIGGFPQSRMYASAMPRLPCSSIGQSRGERTSTVACGLPCPSRSRSSPSTIVSWPECRWASTPSTTRRARRCAASRRHLRTVMDGHALELERKCMPVDQR